MQFHFVKLTHTGTYLSMVDPKQKPRFVCFPKGKSVKNILTTLPILEQETVYGLALICLLIVEN